MNYCQLARASLSHWLEQGKPLQPQSLVGANAGCFVTLLEKNGSLRGCMGTLFPTQKSLSLEIAKNAVSAGTKDPRFPVVALQELPDLQFEVSVLSPPESIDGPEHLDPSVYGVIVKDGNRQGVLLPDLDGIDRVEQQIGIAKRKAEIDALTEVELWRFTVEKFVEQP